MICNVLYELLLFVAYSLTTSIPTFVTSVQTHLTLIFCNSLFNQKAKQNG